MEVPDYPKEKEKEQCLLQEQQWVPRFHPTPDPLGCCPESMKTSSGNYEDENLATSLGPKFLMIGMEFETFLCELTPPSLPQTIPFGCRELVRG